MDPDPGVSEHHLGYMLYVGRLVEEKGVATLLRAWRMLSGTVPLNLKIVGDGPLAGLVSHAVLEVPGVEWLGRRTPAEVRALMGGAAALIVPSEWHEPFGLVAIEAFARGTPVLAARSGALPEIVESGRTGLLFAPASPQALLSQVCWAVDHPPQLAEMGRAARETFEHSYTPENNYAQLSDIYRAALRRHRAGIALTIT